MTTLSRRGWLALALFVVACTGSSGQTIGGPGVGPGGATVGGACHTNVDCTSLCSTSGDFPGMCTVACKSDVDCPAGTVCVSDQGGMCALSCAVPADCASMGTQFTCKSKDRMGGSGEALVCRKD